MLFADPAEARLVLRVNKQYYRGLTLTSRLQRGTVLYGPSAYEREYGVASADEHEPTALKARCVCVCVGVWRYIRCVSWSLSVGCGL